MFSFSFRGILDSDGRSLWFFVVGRLCNTKFWPEKKKELSSTSLSSPSQFVYLPLCWASAFYSLLERNNCSNLSLIGNRIVKGCNRFFGSLQQTAREAEHTKCSRCDARNEHESTRPKHAWCTQHARALARTWMHASRHVPPRAYIALGACTSRHALLGAYA